MTTPIQTRSTDSLASFLTAVSALSRDWKTYWVEKRAKEDGLATAWLPWFRGEESAAWASTTALQPKLYRNGFNTKTILEHEQEIRVEFRRRGAQLISERYPVDKWEWYFLMQHYRAPTRLLDWSDAALVALHFAVSLRGGKDDKYADADAAVYMLDPWWLNDQAFKEVMPVAEKYQSVGPALPDWDEAKPYLPDEFDNEELGLKRPLSIDPSHFSRRIAAQRSRFTIFGREKDGLKVVANSVADSHLIQFVVKKESIPDIKGDLRLAGISEETIFPDLEGLGRELSYWFEDNCLDVGSEYGIVNDLLLGRHNSTVAVECGVLAACALILAPVSFGLRHHRFETKSPLLSLSVNCHIKCDWHGFVPN